MNDGGNIFTLGMDPKEQQITLSTELTVRDWFAGIALMGLLAGHSYGPGEAENLAYLISDGMIERRKT